MELFPNKVERERDLLWFFNLALLLRGIGGAFEVLVALLVLFIPPSLVLTMAEFVTGGELSQDPSDPIANVLVSAAHSFAIHSHYLLALYVAVHGTIKILLVVGIFAGKRIAYPLFMIAIAFFGTYEAYLGFARQHTLLQVLAVFDVVLFFLTMHEYRQRYPRRVENEAGKKEKATFAAGCFWGVEASFRTMPGVLDAVSGYAGGHVAHPSYEQVSSGTSGHAETVEMTYDPDTVSYETLVKNFFQLHDPTQMNRQGPDVGEQYRSVIFYHSPEQKETAERVKKELAPQYLPKTIATSIEPAKEFWRAEEYHQRYAEKHPGRVVCHI